MKREDIISFIAANKAKFEQEFGLIRIGLFGSYQRKRCLFPFLSPFSLSCDIS